MCKLVCRLIRGDIAASLLTNTLLTQEGGGAGKVLPISRKKVVRKDLADTQSETASVKKGHHHSPYCFTLFYSVRLPLPPPPPPPPSPSLPLARHTRVNPQVTVFNSSLARQQLGLTKAASNLFPLSPDSSSFS